MEFNEKKIASLIEELSLYDDIELLDIPDLDLYMDQIITLFDDKLTHLKRNDDEKVITKTMINNYAKAKILMPPIKKKYTKNHIILLILIYNLKQGLSINDIKLLFTDLIHNLNNENDIELDKIYESFLHIKKSQADEVCNELATKIKLIKDNTSDLSPNNLELSQMIIAVLSLINESNIRKRLAEKMIDEFFSDNQFK